MSEENKEKAGQAEEKKIILPKETQIEMMKFFMRTSIPQKKRRKEEQLRLSNPKDGSDK